MSAWLYDSVVADVARGDLDWENNPVRVALFTGNYQPSQTQDSSYEQIARYEVQPSGTYKTGGSMLDRRTVERAANNTRLNAGVVEWSSFTGAFRWAVAYRSDTGQLIGCADLGHQQTTGSRVAVDYRIDGFAAFTAEAA